MAKSGLVSLTSSSARILLALAAGLGLGIVAAALAPSWLAQSISVAEPIGSLWLDALRMTIVPLVFSLLVTGIASAATSGAASSLAARALVLFLIVMFLAGLFGEASTIAFLHWWPIPPEAADAMRAAMSDNAATVPPPTSITQWLGALLPDNPIRAAADGDMLPLVIFALVLGLAITRIKPERSRQLIEFFQALVDAMLVIVQWVILAGPFGVFALAYTVGAKAGIGAIGAFAHYLALLVAIQVVLILLIYPLAAAGGRMSMARFARAVAPAQAVATSTQSSLASLPAMLEASQQLRLPTRVSALVLPLAVSVFRITGPVANLAVVVYCASLFGVDVSLGQLLVGAVVAVFMSVAAVGLPGQVSFFTSIVPLCAVMGVPVGALPLLLAIETIPDIFRTIGNVTADVAATAVLAGPSADADIESR